MIRFSRVRKITLAPVRASTSATRSGSTAARSFILNPTWVNDGFSRSPFTWGETRSSSTQAAYSGPYRTSGGAIAVSSQRSLASWSASHAQPSIGSNPGTSTSGDEPSISSSHELPVLP